MSKNVLKPNSQSEFVIKDNAATLTAKLALLKANYARGEFCDEIRSYRVPAFIVRKEYELLSYYEQETFFDLPDIVCADLCAILFLMKEFDIATDVSGDTMRLIAGNISRSVELLRHICTHQADFRLLQVTTPE